MVRRRHAQLELSQVVLFGLVLPEPERLMEPWLREVDKALEDEEIVDAVMTVMRRRWQQRARRGRAGTPAEVVLRMLALKHLPPGGQARISRLKNPFGMRRSRYRGRSGVDRCIGWAAIANNLVAIGRFRAERPSP